MLSVTNPTIRCVVGTRPQPGLEKDLSVTRQLAQKTNRFLGIYADVATAGTVRVADEATVYLPPPPNVVERTATAVGKSASRGLQKIVEATVLRFAK